MEHERTPRFDADEATRRMPALLLIEDDDIRAETTRLVQTAPAYFWEVPASTSGFHHPVCRGKRGLWAHSLMVTTVVERLLDSYRQRDVHFEAVDADCARSAAILHDMRKNGNPDDPAEKSISDHDLYMRDVVGNTDLPERVGDAVARHMGPWYDGPEPETPLDRCVHTADMVASTAAISPSIPEPVPRELRSLGLTGHEF